MDFDSMLSYFANKYNQDEELARSIIHCESRNIEDAENENYDDGVHWSTDYGYWQINDYWHEEVALERGFDIYTGKGNLEYGFILLSEQSTEPWSASKSCWQNINN